MSSLLEMTDVPMTNILEKCGFKSVLTLRKVCHSLRNFIDDSCFKTDLDNIRITIGPTGFLLICNSPNALSTNGFCFAKDWTLNDLKIVPFLCHHQPLQQRFEMGGSEICKVLPYIDSKTLKEIYIRPARRAGTDDQVLDGMEEVIELEQFKNAVEPSLHMQSFNLGDLKLNENQFEQVFGTPFHDPLRELDSSQWFFKMQSCKEYVLRIDWHLEQLTFWNWKATEVPQGAIVQH
ncbi:unnamed protein product [Caenorhabditis brenneri]